MEDVALAEIKAGDYVYNSAQISAEPAAAFEEMIPMYLIVSPATTVASTTLADVAPTGGQVVVFDSSTGIFTAYGGGSVLPELLEFLIFLL